MATVISLNDCIKGRLYLGEDHFDHPENIIVGDEFCDTLELPYRNNLNKISACREGVYGGKIRTDGSKGWRIELNGTQPRENVQIHIGNSPKDVVGCILPGRWSAKKACFVGASGATLNVLKGLYEHAPGEIRIKIISTP